MFKLSYCRKNVIFQIYLQRSDRLSNGRTDPSSQSDARRMQFLHIAVGPPLTGGSGLHVISKFNSRFFAHKFVNQILDRTDRLLTGRTALFNIISKSWARELDRTDRAVDVHPLCVFYEERTDRYKSVRPVCAFRDLRNFPFTIQRTDRRCQRWIRSMPK